MKTRTQRSPRIVQPHIPGLARVDKAPTVPKIKESALVSQIRATLANVGYATFEVGQARQKVKCPNEDCGEVFYPTGFAGTRRALLTCSPIATPKGSRLYRSCWKSKPTRGGSARNNGYSRIRAGVTSSGPAPTPWKPCGMRRNGAKARVDWQFTTADARVKLKRLDPKILTS
ncbi:MAG: hypothetical protein H8F28_20485 [Fibrella sp.]|nr:hypothetical protein [Armatimonadota bacterium]